MKKKHNHGGDGGWETGGTEWTECEEERLDQEMIFYFGAQVAGGSQDKNLPPKSKKEYWIIEHQRQKNEKKEYGFTSTTQKLQRLPSRLWKSCFPSRDYV